MPSAIHIKAVTTTADLRRFIKFPWRVYADDPNWVPSLISDQYHYLNPKTGIYYRKADIALFHAFRDNTIVGTIAAFIDRVSNAQLGKQTGGFGFFEVIDDFAVAANLLDTAFNWLRHRGITLVKGPFNFSENDRPGILIGGADCPPVILAAHTPPYYQEILEKYGMEKDHDLYAWRAFRSQIGDELKNLPPELNRVAEVARKVAQVSIRKINLDNWNEEIKTACYLFNETLKHLPDHVPFPENEFLHLSNQLRPFLDPDLALFAEKDGKAIGFCVAIPDANRVLIHLNGRLFPFGWLRIKSLIQQIDVASFKLMGVLEEYRRRGIDALLYLEAIKEVQRKGYQWIDGSVTSEFNPIINLIAQRLGAEQYKHYRVYQMRL